MQSLDDRLGLNRFCTSRLFRKPMCNLRSKRRFGTLCDQSGKAIL